MLEAFLLSFLWTLSTEQANVLIKKYEALHTYQKIFLIILSELIVGLMFWILFNDMHYDFNFYSVILTLINSLSVFWFFYFYVKSVEIADRSLVAIFSVIILPALIIADYFMGYKLDILQIFGILWIVAVLVYSSYSNTLNLKGLKYVLLSQFFWFLSIVSFKILIMHYSSVYAQMALNAFIVSIIYLILLLKKLGQDAVWFILKKDYLLVGAFYWVGSLLAGLAYLFWPATIVTAFKRVWAMFWWVVFGKLVFHEINFWKKLANVMILLFLIFWMNENTFASNLTWIKKLSLVNLKTDVNWKAEAKVEYYVPPKEINKNVTADVFLP